MAKTHPAQSRNAIDFLTDDHRRIARLFDDFDELDRDDSQSLQELVETTCIELQIHSILEEELFYPAVRAHVATADEEVADRLNEAQIEHESVDALIARLQELHPDEALYAGCFKVLAAYVKHHVHEEERSLFPRLHTLGVNLQQLAEDMRLRREALFAEMEADDELDVSASDDPDPVEEESNEEALETLDLPRTRH
jgi:iron-sulfur cluster repair protein YtfE (RIC family)